MQVDVVMVLPCAPSQLAPWVDDLSAYPEWMGLVHRAAPQPGDGPAWAVDLRARVGPLARSKRLRMVRTTPPGPGTVQFERRELDGRTHGRWEFTVVYDAVAGRAEHTDLSVVLRYDGALWTAGVLERILQDEIERSKERLYALVSEGRSPLASGGPTR